MMVRLTMKGTMPQYAAIAVNPDLVRYIFRRPSGGTEIVFDGAQPEYRPNHADHAEMRDSTTVEEEFETVLAWLKYPQSRRQDEPSI